MCMNNENLIHLLVQFYFVATRELDLFVNLDSAVLNKFIVQFQVQF